MKLIYHRQEWPEHNSTYIMTEDGSGMVRVTYEKLKGIPEAVISDLCVYKDRRREGIGSLLLKAATEQYRDKVTRYYLVVKKDLSKLDEDKELHGLFNFYSLHGFKVTAKYNGEFIMELDSAPLECDKFYKYCINIIRDSINVIRGMAEEKLEHGTVILYSENKGFIKEVRKLRMSTKALSRRLKSVGRWVTQNKEVLDMWTKLAESSLGFVVKKEDYDQLDVLYRILNELDNNVNDK